MMLKCAIIENFCTIVVEGHQQVSFLLKRNVNHNNNKT